MTQKQLLIGEIKKAPDDIFQEIFDFYQYLKIKSNKKINGILLASESSLKKDLPMELIVLDIREAIFHLGLIITCNFLSRCWQHL